METMEGELQEAASILVGLLRTKLASSHPVFGETGRSVFLTEVVMLQLQLLFLAFGNRFWACLRCGNVLACAQASTACRAVKDMAPSA